MISIKVIQELLCHKCVYCGVEVLYVDGDEGHCLYCKTPQKIRTEDGKKEMSVSFLLFSRTVSLGGEYARYTYHTRTTNADDVENL